MTCPRSRGQSAVWVATTEARAAGGRVQDVSCHGNSHHLPPRLSYGSGPQGGLILGDAGAGHSPRCSQQRVSDPALCSEAMSPAQAAGLLSAPQPARLAEECLKSPVTRDTQHCYTVSGLNDIYKEHTVVLFLEYLLAVSWHEMSYSAQNPDFKYCADNN